MLSKVNKIKMLNSRLSGMRYRQLYALLFFLAIGLPSAFGQIGGSGTYDFLDIPVSARASAMGGNYVIVRDGDLGIAANNPSFLDSSVDRHIILTYVPYFAGIQYGYASYAQTFKKIGTFDAGIKYIDYGTFTQADAGGNITGTFSASEYLLNIGYGRPLLDSLISGGANLKMVYSHLAQYNSVGVAIDAGASYISRNRRFYAGFLIQNVGTQLKDYTTGNSEALPFDIDAGIAEKLLHAPFRFDLTFQHLQTWDLTYVDPVDSQTVNPLTGQAITRSKLAAFGDKILRHLIPGVEILLGKNFAIRIAYNYERRQELKVDAKTGIAGFSAGFGIKIYKFQLSYALASYHLGGTTNTFTIGFNIDDFVPHKPETTDLPEIAPSSLSPQHN